MKTMNLFLAATAMIATSAAWADDIRLGFPAYGGTGCPQGTASATLSPDMKSLSLLFDAFQVEAGAQAGTTIARKNCDIAVPVHVPQGLSFSIIGIDFRGYNHLPAGARSIFSVQYFFAGGRGIPYSQMFQAPWGSTLDSDYYIPNELQVGAIVWSACGVDVNLRASTSMRVMYNGYEDKALSTVDSMDISAGIVYRLAWRSCNGNIGVPSVGGSIGRPF
ncbi:MAG: DUF4360 domain-containing protein [Bdellovibrionota bacterium]